MSIASDVKTVLEADTALMAILTGGLWTGFTEINRQDVPGAFDANKEIMPCALIKIGTEMPRGPYKKSTRTAILIYFYQRAGNNFIESAMDRTYALLHEAKIGSGTFLILHEDTVHSYDIAQRETNAIDSFMALMRFGQYRLRL